MFLELCEPSKRDWIDVMRLVLLGRIREVVCHDLGKLREVHVYQHESLGC